jgi:hypothetical protein
VAVFLSLATPQILIATMDASFPQPYRFSPPFRPADWHGT